MTTKGLVYAGTVLFAGLSCLSYSDAEAEEIEAAVVRVTDGDTIVVTCQQREETIRLASIDCPELSQRFGVEAREKTMSLCEGRTVTIDGDRRDRFGRLIAFVKLPDGQVLNKSLVKLGLAWWYQKYATHDAELASLESDARRFRRGLWRDEAPISPWRFRALKTGRLKN